jgi:hypothetical protein
VRSSPSRFPPVTGGGSSGSSSSSSSGSGSSSSSSCSSSSSSSSSSYTVIMDVRSCAARLAVSPLWPGVAVVVVVVFTGIDI